MNSSPKSLLAAGLSATLFMAGSEAHTAPVLTQNHEHSRINAQARPSDSNTGGGMGGTGYSVDQPQSLPIVPLSGQSGGGVVSCPADQVIGRYRLRLVSEHPPSTGITHESQLCLNTIFTLTQSQTLEMILPEGRILVVETDPGAQSAARFEIRRVTHAAWGSRIDIDIYALNGTARVTINGETLEIKDGFVGQVQIEGTQEFFSLRRQQQRQDGSGR